MKNVNVLAPSLLHSSVWSTVIVFAAGLITIGCTAVDNRSSVARAAQALSQHHYAEATVILDTLLAAHPDSARWLRWRGYAHDMQREYQFGLKDFRAALRANPQDALVWNNLGYAQQQLGMHEQAQESLSRAITLNPKLGTAHSNRAFSLIALTRYQEALEDLDNAFQYRGADIGSLHNLRGFCLMELGLPSQSLPEFNAAISDNPNYADAIRNRALAVECLRQQKNTSR